MTDVSLHPWGLILKVLVLLPGPGEHQQVRVTGHFWGCQSGMRVQVLPLAGEAPEAHYWPLQCLISFTAIRIEWDKAPADTPACLSSLVFKPVSWHLSLGSSAQDSGGFLGPPWRFLHVLVRLLLRVPDPLGHSFLPASSTGLVLRRSFQKALGCVSVLLWLGTPTRLEEPVLLNL